jgi:hypothetical protein
MDLLLSRRTTHGKCAAFLDFFSRTRDNASAEPPAIDPREPGVVLIT